jgi:hypothetical protein
VAGHAGPTPPKNGSLPAWRVLLSEMSEMYVMDTLYSALCRVLWREPVTELRPRKQSCDGKAAERRQ